MISNNSTKIKMKKELRKIFNNKHKIKDNICDEIINFLESFEFKSICLYNNIKNELNIDKVFNYLINKDVHIIYPFMKKDDDKMTILFKEYNGHFVYDDYKIKSTDGNLIDINFCDIILIPGLAYNKYGYRLGYGKGFYDIALKDYRGIKIGVVSEENIINDHFEEAHDIKVDYLVSEKRIIKI